jgi:lysozyme
MRISERGLDLIKDFEGLVLKAYPDPATGGDPWTIGYGHTGPDVRPGMTITHEEADRLLEEDCLKFEKGVTELIKAPRLLQHEFDALVSFAFNCGLGNLKESTLLKKLNAEDYIGAANEFQKWNKAAGKVMPGLTRRRQAEERLFRGQR